MELLENILVVNLLEGEIPPGGAPPGGRAVVLWEIDHLEEGPPDDLLGGVGDFVGMEIGGSLVVITMQWLPP